MYHITVDIDKVDVTRAGDRTEKCQPAGSPVYVHTAQSGAATPKGVLVDSRPRQDVDSRNPPGLVKKSQIVGHGIVTPPGSTL